MFLITEHLKRKLKTMGKAASVLYYQLSRVSNNM